MNFIDLPGDLHFEIFQWLKPYTLNQVSLTSKELRSKALIKSLWDKHLTSEFPYSLEKGNTSFEKYSQCKRKSLCKIVGSIHRKCALLVEAGHLKEIKDNLPESVNIFLLQVNSLPKIINEQDDQEMKDFFYNEVVKDTTLSNFWKIVFGKVELLNINDQSTINSLFCSAIEHGSKESLNYLFQHYPDLDISGSILTTRSYGSPAIVKWLFDHGAQFNKDHFLEAARVGNKEFVLFLLEKITPSPELIKLAIGMAVYYGRPGTLEVLLPHVSQDKANLNPLLANLNFLESPNETAACLKMLLDKGADVDYPKVGPRQKVTPLFLACSYPNNEMSIEILLSKGANKNYNTPYNLTPLAVAIQKNYPTVLNLLGESHSAD